MPPGAAVERRRPPCRRGVRRVGPALDGRRRAARGSRPSSARPRRRRPCVAAAVDVDEALEVGEVGRQARPSTAACEARRARPSASVAGARCVTERPSIGRGSLRGPAGALSCPDRATHRDPAARGTQRLPARAGGQARGRHRSPADLVRPARPGPARAGPARRRASRRGSGPTGRRGRRLGPPAAAEHGEGRAPAWRSIARPTPGTGSSRSRGPARSARGPSPRPRWRWPSATCRRPARRG